MSAPQVYIIDHSSQHSKAEVCGEGAEEIRAESLLQYRLRYSGYSRQAELIKRWQLRLLYPLGYLSCGLSESVSLELCC